jgi:glucose/arabinose dehydrogenase
VKWGTQAGVAAALLLVAACGDDSSGEAAAGGPTTEITEAASEAGADTTTPETTPPAPPTTRPPAPPPPVTQLEAVKIKATPVVDTPMLTAIAWREGDPNPYITDQHGTIYHVVGGRSEPVLDLTPQVLDYEPGAEYGLLGIAFDPMDGRMIVGYNDLDVDTNIVSFALAADGRPDPASVREILRVDQPGMGHKGGHLAFDAAGNLLISMGDGGGSSGADAQDMTKLLGGLLRITPNRNGPGYTVPADNPYVGQPGIAPEIWAKGMRNPWRF